MALMIMLPITAKSFSQPDKIPPFQIMQANGKVFLAGNLPAGKPIVIIYFSPDCKECHDLTAEMLNRIEEFENISIAMITNMPVGHVKYFVSQFSLGKYPNIYVGTEGYSSFVGGYYHVDKIPFLALHNKNGDLEKVYRGEVSIEDLLVHLRRL
jgi:thiol-disulfide isomerase/thioredoxin